MNITRDDNGKIAHLHTEASGLRPATRSGRSFRDTSGGISRTSPWRQAPTPIQPPGRALKSKNPYSGRMTSGRGGRVHRVGDSNPSTGPLPTVDSSPSHVLKRAKLTHNKEDKISKYFSGATGSRSLPSSPQAAPSFHPICPTDAIVIDEEGDETGVDNNGSKPTALKASSPDPMDLISSETSYTFDQSKPSPVHQLSSTFERTHRSPKDGESTARLRSQLQQTDGPEIIYRPGSDDNRVQPTNVSPMSPRNAPTGKVDASSENSKVRKLAAAFEPPGVRHLNLRPTQSRKNGMKPKQPQRNVPALPIMRLDQGATRTSGFISGSRPEKGKGAQRSVVCNLPLKEWSIGGVISPHKVTSERRFNLIWEPEVLRVQDTNSSTLFELQVKKRSLGHVKYVDTKRSTVSEPLIQINSFEMGTARNFTSHEFDFGSPDTDCPLTFKFDTCASEWDTDTYMRLVQSLLGALVLGAEKSILLGESAAKAVWEAVMRANKDQSVQSDLEPLPLAIPKEISDSPSKLRPRLKSRIDATSTDFFVRRSARLSGVETKRFSPRPDPDEVILGYRSGTGSLNITNGDVSRLEQGEFLNDTLIEFGLKLWLADLQESNPELASQVHVFSSFFYKKLSTKIPKEGYNSVRKWTSKFDLFQKKYIIVPINENLHWYLAIIYFPEYTLLPRPVQKTDAYSRRSTRRLGVIVDSSDAQHPEPAPEHAPPPDPGPPPNGQVNSVPRSELILLESPKTDDQKDEIDVERMVESGGTLADSSVKQIDRQCVGVARTDSPLGNDVDRQVSPTLLYPPSSPHSRPESSDPEGDIIERGCHPVSGSMCEENSILRSGIPVTTFYGKKSHGERSGTFPQTSSVVDSAQTEIEIEEDETIVNANSEPEEATEHLKTYIYTFDSLLSKHPQAVKRLSRYLLMEAHDKKQLEEDVLTEPKGMNAIVPHQNNYCDCGIYLLHFAKIFMKDPKLSSEIIRSRSSLQKGRSTHEYWDRASVGSYREELRARIQSMSKEWKRQRSEQDSASRDQPDSEAPQEQTSGNQTPAASTKAGHDSDSDIEVLGPPKKALSSKGPRGESGPADSKKKGPVTRVRG